MSVPIGHEWYRLLPLEDSRQVLQAIFDVDYSIEVDGEMVRYRFLAEAIGHVLKNGPWPIKAKERANRHVPRFPWLDSVFDGREEPKVSPWSEISDRLPDDPDFRSYVKRAAWAWLRRRDEYKIEDVTQTFAWEGLLCTVEHAGDWHARRPTLVGKAYDTWVWQLEQKLGKKPVSRLVKSETGRPPGEGEKRGERRQGGYPGTSATSLSKRDAKKFDRTAANCPSPEDLCIRREQIEQLNGALQKLPTQERRILMLHFEHGLTYRAIAKSEGVNEASVRQAISHSLQVLKDDLTGKADLQ